VLIFKVSSVVYTLSQLRKIKNTRVIGVIGGIHYLTLIIEAYTGLKDRNFSSGYLLYKR